MLRIATTVLNTTEKDIPLVKWERNTRYWEENYVKQVLYHCIICRRLNARPYNYPESPNLLLPRVDDSYPFICKGRDYTGAVYWAVRELFSYYIVTYTCVSTRGVILDVVPDGSAEIFINSSSQEEPPQLKH